MALADRQIRALKLRAKRAALLAEPLPDFAGALAPCAEHGQADIVGCAECDLFAALDNLPLPDLEAEADLIVHALADALADFGAEVERRCPDCDGIKSGAAALPSLLRGPYPAGANGRVSGAGSDEDLVAGGHWRPFAVDCLAWRYRWEVV